MSPRAGHSGAVLGDIWYIVGGGNNVKGCADLLAADLAELPTSNTLTWHVVTSVREGARRRQGRGGGGLGVDGKQS